jgi:hypothetical protein
VKLFFDTSVLLATAGSATGASRAVIDLAARNRGTLITSRYCVGEVESNLFKLPAAADTVWRGHICPPAVFLEAIRRDGRLIE